MTIDERRSQAAAGIGRACRRAPDSLSLLAEAGRLIGQAVAHDDWDLQVYDPEAMLPIAAVAGTQVPWEVRLAHCELEQQGHDANPFRILARRPRPIATLGRATAGQPETSRRYRDLLAPAGIRHELRAALVHQDSCWGALSLLRGSGPDFSSADERWLATIAPQLAAALQRHALATPSPAGATIEPGVVTLQHGAPPVAQTTAGEMWLDALARPLPIHSAATLARVTGTATLRVPSAYGWASLHAASNRNSDRLTVVVQRAGAEALIPMLARAYGLTPAQRRVVALIMRGLTVAEISARLLISADTVRDHVKAVYRKTGATSHATLRHRLALDSWALPVDPVL